MISRRSFLAFTGGTTLGLYAHGRPRRRRMLATLATAVLDPVSLPKYLTPLLVPPVMPSAGRIRLAGGKNVDYYEISMKQFPQQILPAGWPATTVWGYGAVSAQSKTALLLHNAPSPTIEARYDTPVRVKWINDLKDANGNFLPHLLPVDPTLYWAHPPGGNDGRDARPVFGSTPGRYTGPVPMVTHVHGAVGVGDESDGYAQAWYLPAAGNIPAGHASRGRWYDFFAAKAASKFGVAWGPGFAVFQYPNRGRAATEWYHDHTLGMTRLNVYAGPAGFYINRGGPQGDDAVVDARSGVRAVLPGPAPKETDRFPPNKAYGEIAVAIQDRAFNSDGSLFYPDTRAFFDGIVGPFIPDTDISPIWNPEFFGNTIVVNGNTWPFHTVEQRRYRFRLLNGCQARFLILDFSGIAGVSVWQIGNEGGFLAAPVDLGAVNALRLPIAPAERADLIVDFGGVATGHHVLRNVGPDAPFGGGLPGIDFAPADPQTTGQILQFRVVPALTADPTTPPNFLSLPPPPVLPAPTVTRRLALLEAMSQFFADTPAETLLGTLEGDPAMAPARWTPRAWADPVTENPEVGATEVWEFYNATADAHPVHIHEVKFEVTSRQDILVDEANRSVQLLPGSSARPPEPWESGFKDTVIALPGQVTRIRAQFAGAGQFAWHCHIVEHEDNEMMRPYRIGPLQDGQPT